MNSDAVQLRVTIECGKSELAKRAEEVLRNFNRYVTDVVVEVVGTVVYMTFNALRAQSLTILGVVKDLLGQQYSPTIGPAH